MTKPPVTGARTSEHVESPNVLRDIPVHEVPHALLRRGVLSSRPVVVDVATEGVTTPPVDTLEQERQAGYAAGFDEGMRAGQAQGHKQGYESGYQQGTEEGCQDGLKKGQELVQKEQVAVRKVQDQFQEGRQRLDSILSGASDQISKRLAEAEDDMVALCFDAVCRIAGQEFATATGVRHHLLNALRDWNKRVALKVHMHPNDLALLQQETLPSDSADENPATAQPASESIAAELERMGHNQVQWVPDASIVLGGCVLRSSEGGMDARLQTQLEALRSVFLEVRQTQQLAMRTRVDGAPAPVPRKRAGRRASDNRG